uniref:Uncharacterized protein n=1 Tax=Anopheles coluzzii TaxID=1518534 RepID=A0A8W7PI45_ANOCL
MDVRQGNDRDHIVQNDSTRQDERFNRQAAITLGRQMQIAVVRLDRGDREQCGVDGQEEWAKVRLNLLPEIDRARNDRQNLQVVRYFTPPHGVQFLTDSRLLVQLYHRREADDRLTRRCKDVPLPVVLLDQRV